MPTRSPDASSVRTQAITAMVLNIVSVLFCCLGSPFGIAGAVVAGIAIGRTDRDIHNAKKLVAWGWGLLAASIVLGIVVLAFFFSVGAFDRSASSTDFNTMQ